MVDSNGSGLADSSACDIITCMGIFGRFRSKPISPAIEQYLEQFIATIVLVATDGEWTRREIPDMKWGHKFAARKNIAAYDAAVVGYPQRMRDYNKRRKGRQF